MEARYVPERMYIRMPRDTALALSECAEAYFDMDVRSMAVILVEEALLSRGFLESDQIRVIMSVSSESIEEVVGLLKSGQRGAEEPGRKSPLPPLTFKPSKPEADFTGPVTQRGTRECQ